MCDTATVYACGIPTGAYVLELKCIDMVFPGTLSVAYLLIFVLVKGIAWGVNIETLPVDQHPGKDAAVLSGMLALSFYIHNIIITIMSNNDRQENNVSIQLLFM